MLRKKQEIEIEIEKVAFGGKGLGRIGDFVVFVENTLPGDVVVSRIQRVKKNYAEARPLKFLRQSPLREKAPCEHFGICGGCRWQDVPYPAQLQIKREHVIESLQHIGRISSSHVKETIPSPLIFGYRNKMEFSFASRGWLSSEELANPEIEKGYALGLHVRGAFNKIIDIKKCWLQSDVLNSILLMCKRFFKDSGLPVYDLRSHEGILRFLVLRESFHNHEVMVNVVTSEPITSVLEKFAAEARQQFPQIVSVVNNINTRPAQIAQGEEEILISGRNFIREKLGEFIFEISSNSFFQTNTLQAENLYKVMLQFAQPEGVTVWDLYAGTGTVAIFLSRQAGQVVGFEILNDSVQDAIRNAKLNGVSNCRFIAGDLRYTLQQEDGPTPEVIVCDPPRSGMHPDVLQVIRKISPLRIVYVSCNPTTLARDLSALTDLYDVEQCQPLDMFPHTYHIESVTKLVRK